MARPRRLQRWQEKMVKDTRSSSSMRRRWAVRPRKYGKYSTYAEGTRENAFSRTNAVFSERIAKNQPIEHLVDEKVAAYIRDKGLFQ